MTMIRWLIDILCPVYSFGGGGGGGDGGAGQAAAEATQREQERQARVAEAQRLINRVFQGGGAEYGPVQVGSRTVASPVAAANPSGWISRPLLDAATQAFGSTRQEPIYEQQLVRPATQGFTDDFFNQRRQAMLDYYSPQLEDQYSKAREQLTYALARAGLLRSSAANTGVADIAKQHDTGVQDIGLKADQAMSQLRGDIEGQRQTLLQQAVASQDPALSSNMALAAQRNIAQSAPTYSPLANAFNVAAYGAGNFAQGQEDARTRAAYGLPPRSILGRTISDK